MEGPSGVDIVPEQEQYIQSDVVKIHLVDGIIGEVIDEDGPWEITESPLNVPLLGLVVQDGETEGLSREG